MNNNNYSSYKIGAKNIILILVAAFIVAGAFVLAEYRNRDQKKVAYVATVSTTTEYISQELQYKDSDEDGLKDWEELLLGTDAENPDTDEDGTSDGKESLAGRNPLVKGPKDTQESTSSIIQKENLTATDKLARDFFARYMELKQIGLSQDKTSQQELVGQVLKGGLVLNTPETYSLKGIKTTEDSSKESIRRYGNEIGDIFRKNVNYNIKNEVVIAKESIDKEDIGILKEIDPIIDSYRNIVDSLKKVTAPDSLSEIHLDMLNNLSLLLFSAEMLRKTDTDPVLGLQGINTYLLATKGLSESFNSFKNNLISLSISYSTNESGSFFILPK